MIEPDEALARILEGVADVAPLPPERVSLREALGRALAEDVAASRPLPPFDSSMMDGFALRALDAALPGARLPVAFEVYAGGAPPPPLPPRTCCRIFTGAPVPDGADCVEMQEEVAREGGLAIFARAAELHRFVRRAGSDVAQDAVVLRRGAPIDPGAIGFAAAVGRTELAVHRRPRVGILATGDELVAAGGRPGPTQLLESNSHALAAACVEAGAVPVLLPAARDTPASIEASLSASAGLDVLVSSGGVSVGERDLVRPALEAHGARLHFWRIAIKPGKPVVFGRRGATAVFGLPGNPVSSLVTFELFVRPALRRLAGLAGPGRPVLSARLATAFEKPAGLTHYLRARAWLEEGGLVVDPLPSQVSADLSSSTGYQALAVVPKAATRVPRGGRVQALLLAPPAAAPREST